MKHNLKRILILCLSCLLFAALLTVTIYAKDGKDRDSDGRVNWVLSEDEKTLSDGDKTYTLYESPYPLEVLPEAAYLYSNRVYYSTYGGAQVKAASKDAEFVWTTVYSNTYLYATEEGKKALDALIEDQNALYYVSDDANRQALVVNDLIRELEVLRTGGSALLTLEVSQLQNSPCTKILAYDATETVYYEFGAVYTYDGELYYIHYPSLDNSHFDADGNFSYRSGEVTMMRLEKETKTLLEDALDNVAYRSTDYENEANDLYEAEAPDISLGVFWTFFVIIGFLAPLSFILPGMLLPRSRERGYPKYWYILAIIGIAWVFLALILMILLLV